MPGGNRRTPGDAVGRLMLNSYDLILLDVKMPEISGFDLCAEIKN